MNELPESITLSDQINKNLTGKTITTVLLYFDDGRSLSGSLSMYGACFAGTRA